MGDHKSVRISLFAAGALLFGACVSPAAPTATATPAPSPTPSVVASVSPSPAAAATPTPTPIGLPTFTQLSALSANVVWALVGGSRLFVSSDRGDSWQERSLPQRDLPNLEVSFVSEREGWAMSSGSPATQCQSQSVKLWQTVDGAVTWMTLTPTGIPDAQCKESLSFIGAGTGFLFGWDPTHATTVLQATDGGRTWNGKTLPDPPGFTSQPGASALRAGRVRAFGTAVFLEAHDSDGGAMRHYVFVWNSNAPTWAYLATVPDAEDAFAFAGNAGGGDLRWLLIAPGGGSRESTDSGQSWHPFTTDYGQAAPVAPVITFADGSIGYATVRGSIQRTTDGGAHWTSIKTPGTLSP